MRHTPALFSIALVASLVAPSMAAVNVTGDVPQAPTTFGFGELLDLNGDLLADTIDDEGNNVFDFLADPNNPTGGPGGLPWNAPDIWADYDTPQNLLVGENGFGTLEVNGASALRYANLVLGGAGGPFLGLTRYMYGTDLDLNVSRAVDEFDFQPDLIANDLPTTGNGVVTVSGFGSVFNNDPGIVPSEFALPLLATGWAAGDPIPSGPVVTGTGTSETRMTNAPGGYDVHVGLLGQGTLNVNSGGRVEVQDALFVGLGEVASGTVNVEGFGSYLVASGRDEFDGTMSDATTEFGSIVGGNGDGSLSVTRGARADFRNGLSIGGANSTTLLSGAATTAGSGRVTVGTVGEDTTTGAGASSTLTVYASRAVRSATGGLIGSNLALAVGELRDTSTNVVPAEALGAGVLEIGRGGRVRIAFDANYTGTLRTGTNVEVGYNGAIRLSGGELRVGDGNTTQGGALTNDGDIQGYGLVRARTLRNTSYSTIQGGDADNGPLRVIIDSAETDPQSADFAVVNLGAITGDVDFTVAGGFSNGDPTQNFTSIDSNGGSLRAEGRIQSATFFNRALSEVHVGPGQDLAILATRDSSVQDDQLTTIVDSGSGATIINENYFQANLGAITVDGGRLELGRLLATGAGTAPANIDRFRNARLVEVVSSAPVERAVGTITVSDGELVFNTGLFNTGVVAFTGGDSTVRGDVLNVGPVDYTTGTPDFIRPGVIMISGDEGVATFTDDLVNAGSIIIGPDNNTLNVLGDFINTAGSELSLSGGSLNGASFIAVAGNAVFGPTVVNFAFSDGSALVDGFRVTIAASQSDLVIGGAIALGSMPGLGAGLRWVVLPDTTSDILQLAITSTALALPGDANLDGIVNAADFTLWRDSLGSLVFPPGSGADFNGNGIVDQPDYDVWLANFGAIASTSYATAVPEPTTALLALLALGALPRRRG